jgi:hypothetical protein
MPQLFELSVTSDFLNFKLNRAKTNPVATETLFWGTGESKLPAKLECVPIVQPSKKNS